MQRVKTRARGVGAGKHNGLAEITVDYGADVNLFFDGGGNVEIGGVAEVFEVFWAVAKMVAIKKRDE